ncbi:uncharacterized protein V1516DRAFT_670636, partial [Lipomyces oligophaga]|uniref:uncharacterized protein n=1 Tax=Lipomyces oligophaga TaxID=45792 RepID=UPI0034CD9E01
MRNQELLWCGDIEIDPVVYAECGKAHNIQLWGPAARKSDTGSKRRHTECNELMENKDRNFERNIINSMATLRATNTVLLASLPLWWISGPLLTLYTTDPESKILLEKLFLTDLDEYAIKGIEIQLDPPTELASSFVLFSQIYEDTDSISQSDSKLNTNSDAGEIQVGNCTQILKQVVIRAVPIESGKPAEDGDPIIAERPTFVAASAEEMKELTLARRRNDKLEQILQKKQAKNSTSGV